MGRHVAPLPANDGNLCSRHGYKGRGSCGAFNTYSRGAKLNDVVPDVALLALAVPLQLLKARWKIENAGEPWLDQLLMSLIKLPVLLDEDHLPVRELLFFGASIGGQSFHSCGRRKKLKRHAMTASILD